MIEVLSRTVRTAKDLWIGTQIVCGDIMKNSSKLFLGIIAFVLMAGFAISDASAFGFGRSMTGYGAGNSMAGSHGSGTSSMNWGRTGSMMGSTGFWSGTNRNYGASARHMGSRHWLR